MATESIYKFKIQEVTWKQFLDRDLKVTHMDWDESVEKNEEEGPVELRKGTGAKLVGWKLLDSFPPPPF